MSEKSPMDRISAAGQETEEARKKSEKMKELGRELSGVAAAELVTRIIGKLQEKIKNDPSMGSGLDSPGNHVKSLEGLMKELAEGKVRLRYAPDPDGFYKSGWGGDIHFAPEDGQVGLAGGSFSLSLLRQHFSQDEWSELLK